MTEIKNWFEESNARIHDCKEYEFIIHKGFKITHYFEDDTYSIQDTRHCDFYKSVAQTDLDIIRQNGFVRGTDIIMYKRNKARVDMYMGLITKLYQKRRKANDAIQKRKEVTLNRKRARTCKENIEKLNATMQFFRLKAEQYEKRNKKS